jgi:NAD(P)-dependent dehydrogenase (short-subunit alcohol dehydrogenase family)
LPEPRVVIVTGGTYGIGRGITLTLAGRGWAVVACGMDGRQMGSMAENGSTGTQAELARQGLTADIVEADVSNGADVDRLVEFTLQRHGRIDALVNNASIHPSGTILETSEEVWDRVLAVNLKGMFLCTKAVLPHLIERGGGAIVNIASRASWGQPNLLAYSASKGGVLGFSYALGYDHLHDGIRVNTVVPSGVATGMNEGSPRRERLARDSVAGRITQPEDVANAVAFLLSDEAETLSGAVLNVNSFAGQGGPIRDAAARDAAFAASPATRSE